MKQKAKKIWEVIGLPMICLAVFMLLWSGWRLLNLPSENELIVITERYFDLYGYWIVLVSAVVEGVLMAGWYYPGGLVIFLGVIFAGKNIPEVALVVGLVIIGMLAAQLFNYALGRFGWYRLLLKFGLRQPLEQAKQRLIKYGLFGIFLSYWHPNVGAFAATAAGILQFSFKKFLLYSIAALVVWNTFWGAFVYFLGPVALNAIGIRFVLVVVSLWLVYRIIFKEKNTNINVVQ